MNERICAVCKKPIWRPFYGTITYTTITGTFTAPAQFGVSGLGNDWCYGHITTILSTSTAPAISVFARQREPVPDAFQQAFADGELDL